MITGSYLVSIFIFAVVGVAVVMALVLLRDWTANSGILELEAKDD